MVWVIVILIIWQSILTGLILVIRNRYSKFLETSDKKSLEDVLDKIIDQLDVNSKDIDKIKAEIKNLSREGELHIQKVGLLRFNPFEETGGDQSFVLAILDKNNNGVVISSLHTRSSTRWYAKKVIEGKSKDGVLSKEEEKVIAKAEGVK